MNSYIYHLVITIILILVILFVYKKREQPEKNREQPEKNREQLEEKVKQLEEKVGQLEKNEHYVYTHFESILTRVIPSPLSTLLNDYDLPQIKDDKNNLKLISNIMNDVKFTANINYLPYFEYSQNDYSKFMTEINNFKATDVGKQLKSLIVEPGTEELLIKQSAGVNQYDIIFIFVDSNSNKISLDIKRSRGYDNTFIIFIKYNKN